ncbi:MAG: GPW/gp25 family protein [Myxococcales bacterium]
MFLYKHFVDGKVTSEIDDIVRNLTNVFGTKRGTGSFLATFGLSDTGFRTPEEMVRIVSAEIVENVRLYEPRVQLIEVDEDFDDNGKRSRLVVQLRLRKTTDRVQIVVDLQGRQIDVKASPAGRR